MTILCIETSTSVCSAAISTDGVLNKQCISYEGGNHARLLPSYIDELLDFAREQHLTIDAVALSEGPGSYTGLRIGASTAKGLCYGLNIPLIPVPTLEVLKIASGIKEGILIPMIDARRMEVYTSINGETKAIVVENEESLLSPFPSGVKSSARSDCQWPSVEHLQGEASVYYFGDGAEKCSKIFTKPNWHYIPGIVPEARFCADYVGSILDFSNGFIGPNTDLAYYEPFYLKEFIAAQSHVKGLK